MDAHRSVDGPKISWLATLGCCASRHQDEDEVELRRDVQKEEHIVSDQPQTVLSPHLEMENHRPSTSYSVGTNISQWVSSGKDYVQRASSRASTLPYRPKPTRRPTISEPTDFRRCDGHPPRRSSFRPLELAICLPDGRLSPLPDFTASDWTQKPANLAYPAQAVLQSRPSFISTTASTFCVPRKPIRSGSIATSASRSSSRQSTSLTFDVDLVINSPQPVHQHLPMIPDSPVKASIEKTMAPLPQSHRRTSTNLSLPVTPSLSCSRSSSRPRSSTSPAPPLRKRPSFLSTKNEIDDAIRELNTIIEERRADAYRTSATSFSSSTLPPPSPSTHVPALVPSLRMRVRSETLSDIGSAFSAPLSAGKPLPLTPGQKSMRPFTLSSPLASPPLSPPRVSRAATVMEKLKPRLEGWLKRQTSHAQSPTKQSFYACQAPAALPVHPAYIPNLHQASNSIASVTTFSTTPPSLARASFSTARSSSFNVLQNPPTPPGSRGRSFSIRSGRSGKGLGRWKGEELVIVSPVEEQRAIAGKRDWVMEKEMRVDPLRMNPKTPVGVAF